MKLRIYFKLCFFILLSIPFSGLHAQEKLELEERKKKNLEELKFTRKMLNQTRTKKQSSLEEVNLLNRQIDLRSSLISNYEEEIENLRKRQIELQQSINHNDSLMNRMKTEYAEIIKRTYRNTEQEYVLMYILSSQDINQAYQRIRYIKYLNDYRNDLYTDIEQRNDSLTMLNERLQEVEKQRELTLASVKTENENLYKDRRQKRKTVQQLSEREEELIEEVREREATQSKIENEIRRLIAEEARKAREANKIFKLTPEEKLISDDFVKNKGGLPWPTVQGIVTGEFGEHPHPVVSGIKVRSNGIDLSTVEGTEVRAVFRGEVTVVSAILGANYTVIIKHGNYRSVYQNLIDVGVKSGDLVETKEVIGIVGTNSNNETKLHFELWEAMEVVNPRHWLSK